MAIADFGSSHFGSSLLVVRPINHWAILFISRSRDLYFSLAMACAEIRKLIYISCVGFARTARGKDAAACGEGTSHKSLVPLDFEQQ